MQLPWPLTNVASLQHGQASRWRGVDFPRRHGSQQSSSFSLVVGIWRGQSLSFPLDIAYDTTICLAVPPLLCFSDPTSPQALQLPCSAPHTTHSYRNLFPQSPLQLHRCRQKHVDLFATGGAALQSPYSLPSVGLKLSTQLHWLKTRRPPRQLLGVFLFDFNKNFLSIFFFFLVKCKRQGAFSSSTTRQSANGSKSFPLAPLLAAPDSFSLVNYSLGPSFQTDRTTNTSIAHYAIAKRNNKTKIKEIAWFTVAQSPNLLTPKSCKFYWR